MNKTLIYQNYPGYIVLVANLVSLGTYLAALYILIQFSSWLTILFILYIIFLELRLLSKSCPACYYYGKRCAFGRGKLSALLFKKGDTTSFSQKCITWKHMIPEILLAIIPIIIGLILLILQFQWTILGAIVLLVFLSSFGNGYVRGSLACNHCKQKVFGCAAYELFNPK